MGWLETIRITLVLVIVAVVTIGGGNYLIRRAFVRRAQVTGGGVAATPGGTWVDVGGIRTFVQIVGAGSPLILIHGSQMNHCDWRFNVDALAKTHTVYALDMVGAGVTDKPAASYSPEYFADFIHAFMQHMGIARALFVASSWGGGHVLRFAIDHPEMVERLALSSPCGINHGMPPLDRLLATPVIGNLLLLFTTRGLVRKQISTAFHRAELIDAELVDRVYAPFFSPGCCAGVVNAYRNADFTEVERGLANVTCPTLIAWGQHDRIHKRAIMDRLQASLPQSQLLVFEHSGHMPHEEEPERFNTAVSEFLTWQPTAQ